jgi:hypothetical protein
MGNGGREEDMRAYSLHRPISIGTWPERYAGITKVIVNFDRYRFVEEIGRHAFGYIEFSEDVPRDELDRFELMVPAVRDERLDRVVGLLVRYSDDEERFQRVWDKAIAMGIPEESLLDGFDKAYGRQS